MCYRQCAPKDHTKAHKQGWRNLIIFPNGGSFKGYWQKSEQHRFGEKLFPGGLIYSGNFKHDKRHGHGILYRKHNNGDLELIYRGQWANDTKTGEGKQFYKDGVYYGFFQDNRRHGLGIYWRENGTLQYIGEWAVDVKHGLGTYFYENGNRYEGTFARGYKNGEGTFYHMSTGQIQKGMWYNGICKTSMVIDSFRNQVKYPTPYPIPVSELDEPDRFIHTIFKQHMLNADKPMRSFVEALCLNFVRKWQKYAKLQASAQSNTQICDGDLLFHCACPRVEVPDKLSYNPIESHICKFTMCKKPQRFHFCFENEKFKKKLKNVIYKFS